MCGVQFGALVDCIVCFASSKGLERRPFLPGFFAHMLQKNFHLWLEEIVVKSECAAAPSTGLLSNIRLFEGRIFD